MLVIRLFRVGKKNQPSFGLVITDKRKSSTKGRFIEEVGFWNPLTKEKVLKGERIKYWLSVGAKPSATVYNLLISEKVIEGKKIPKHKKPKKKEGEKPSAAPAKPAAEPPASTPASTEATAGKEKKLVPKEDAAGKPASVKSAPGKEEKIEGEKIKETTQKPAEMK